MVLPAFFAVYSQKNQIAMVEKSKVIKSSYKMLETGEEQMDFQEGHMGNRVTIIDYTEKGISIYVDLEVFDAAQGKMYREEVRFLDDLLYGDLVHDKRSPLSETCRIESIEYLRTYFDR
ncbi:hypothetical protein M4S82_12580 [Planococcus sp. MERTA32b]|nr:hypothetical protein [Planococcus sp. MER TA 32b]